MPALRIADLRCLRLPAEATLTWFDLVCRASLDQWVPNGVFRSGRWPPVHSNVVRSVSLGLQSALKHALLLGLECPLFIVGSREPSYVRLESSTM